MADPINLPDGIRFAASEIYPVNLKSVSKMEGRHSEVVEFGQPYWVAKYTTSPLRRAQVPILDAWLMRATKAETTFLAYDPTRCRPIKYPNGPLSGTKAIGGAFDGTANLALINNSREVVIDGLPDGFQLSEGDYVSFRMSNLIRSLHMIDEDAISNSSGVVTLNLISGLDVQHFTVGAVVDFEKPSCVMRVLGNPRVSRTWKGQPASFQAEEVFFQ
ncbi:MAG: hypothetical protein JKY94_07930 [Rhodobacteraceae bacterium]|nr:hypothetical protein [Paracoccaceae bacterium]